MKETNFGRLCNPENGEEQFQAFLEEYKLKERMADAVITNDPYSPIPPDGWTTNNWGIIDDEEGMVVAFVRMVFRDTAWEITQFFIV